MESEKTIFEKDEKGRLVKETIKNCNDAYKVIITYEYNEDIKFKTKMIEYFENSIYITSNKLIKDNLNYGVKLQFHKGKLLGGIKIYDELNKFCFRQYFDKNLYDKDFDISNEINIEGKEYRIRIIHHNNMSISVWLNGNYQKVYYNDIL